MATRAPSKRAVRKAPRFDDAGPAAVRVVAIGASAGGLEAFIDLVSAIPADTGLAFVLIQHLDPRHDSMLVGILAASTALPIQEVVDGMGIECDHIYVIPPDKELTIQEDVLRLKPRTAKVPHRPLDSFFCSLAQDRKSNAIGVVLSGNDADGALGLQSIRDAGGTTFAQTPDSAKYDVMPRAAAAAADFVLPPAGIAERLVAIAGGGEAEENAETDEADQAAIERILELLRDHHPVDFSHFKRTSFERRIRRRALLGDHPGLASYAESLEQDPDAVETLYQDILIGVTSFFREPERFDALKTVVFPSIVENRGSQSRVRIWVAGCSTGEEVYSIGIMLLEYLDGRADPPRVYIYGTDINEQSLARARGASYSEQALVDMSPERLERFFTPTAGGYKVGKALRELCVFAAHDVSRDPPYSKIDLVTCCNVLIYFDPELQKKALALLQYAVAPGGFLMLGGSENLRGTSTQLTPVSTKPLIYHKQAVPNRLAALDVAPRSSPAAVVSPSTTAISRRTGAAAIDEDDAFLAGHLAPCGVVVDDQMHITRIRGDVSLFLALEPGDVSLDLFSLLRHHEMLAVLRPAVRRAFRDQAAVTREDILVLDGDVRRRVGFEVIPYPGSAPGRARCWIVFRSAVAPPQEEPPRRQTEIDGLRQALAAAIDDREQLADEATAAAEEAQSSDEELRSTNEELETAKEELQSANEELSTLNDELRLRNTALVKMADDIENLLGAVEIPILFVGSDLTVQRFNTTAGELLNLRSDATGRPLRELDSSLDVSHLEKLVGAVIGTNTPADVEVQDAAGDWRLLRIRACRTSEGKIDGAIVAVVDINVLKRSVLTAEEATRAANILSEASALLASSLDYETTLDELARLSSSTFADWCAVDLLNDDGSIRHLTVAHANPMLRDLALQFQQAAFSDPDGATGAPEALRLRKPVFQRDMASMPPGKVTQLTEALGVCSLISVPLIVRDKVLGTMTFSTSRRRYELVDLQLAEELAQRAAVAIEMAMLFRDAESANRYKDAFLLTVAHELRTPLTSIVGWVQLAKRNARMSADCLVHVDESASLLRVFIEDLLDVARIREQKLKLDVAELDLIAVAKKAIEMTALTASGRDIKVRLHVQAEPVPVRGDKVRLLQVVWNLLSNAIKFTNPGGQIDVRLDRFGDDARVSVADTGAGISPDFVPHVFELYRQADSTGSHTPGLGIGLAIVAQIVKLHGGTVRVESAGLGRGSTFTVSLPALAGPPAPHPQRRSDTSRRGGDELGTAMKAEEPS